MSTTVAIDLMPRVYIGEQPPASSPQPLPDLSLVLPSSTIFLEPLISIPDASINQFLATKLNGNVIRGHSLLFPASKTTVVNTSFSTSGQHVAIGVELAGSLRGTAWLQGTIKYDMASRQARIVDIQFSPLTEARLERVSPLIALRLLNQIRQAVTNEYVMDLGPQADSLVTELSKSLNANVGSNLTLHATFGQVNILGPFANQNSIVFPLFITGSASADFKPFQASLPTGKEIRMVAVTFFTDDDDKDAEEPVDVWVDLGSTGGHPLAHRELGYAERWDDHRTQCPYYFVLTEDRISDCASISLHIRKHPDGSDDGHGWHMHMQADLIRADGTQTRGGHLDYMEWGDGHPYEHRVSMCDSGN